MRSTTKRKRQKPPRPRKETMQLRIIRLLRRMFFFLLPALALIIVFGRYLNLRFVQIVALSAIPIALNYLGILVLHERKQYKRLAMCIIFGISAIVLFGWLWQSYGEDGLAAAWFFGLLAMNALCGIFLWMGAQKQKIREVKGDSISNPIVLRAFSQLFINLATGWFGAVIILPGLSGELFWFNLTGNILCGIISLNFYIWIERNISYATK